MKIVYKNKTELKFLIIGMSLIFGALYLFITISDLAINNPHFWSNQVHLWQVALVFSIPCIIMARHRVVFDFDTRTVTRRGFITPQKTYDFSEFDVNYVIVSPIVSRFDIYLNNKRFLKLECYDFTKQTGESANCLKELFKGEKLEIYNLEKRFNDSDVIVAANKYSFSYGLTIYINNRHDIYCERRIVVEYLLDKDAFLLNFEEADATSKNGYGYKIVNQIKIPHNESFENNLVEVSSWVLEKIYGEV